MTLFPECDTILRMSNLEIDVFQLEKEDIRILSRARQRGLITSQTALDHLAEAAQFVIDAGKNAPIYLTQPIFSLSEEEAEAYYLLLANISLQNP